ncbi:MAG: radical SAM protein [archaeon]
MPSKIALVCVRPKEEARGTSMPPLGIAYLGTILAAKGYTTKLLDQCFNDSQELFEKLKKFNPDVIGVSCMSPFYPEAVKILDFAKKIGAVTIIGGPHITVKPEDILVDKSADFAVIGEGEETILDLLENLDNPEKVKGIAFRNGDKLHIAPPREPIADIDGILHPDFDLLDDLNQYLKSNELPLLSSRGCAFRCSFCQPATSKIWGKTVRFRSPSDVADEIQSLMEKYNIKHFTFVDDNLTLRKDTLEEFCNKIEQFEITFSVNSRVDTLNEEKIKLLKKAGCIGISFGVESGSQKILDTLRKGITIEQIKNTFALCKKYKMPTKAYIMLGSPGESHDTLRRTEELLKEIKPNSVSFSITTPVFGSYLYDEAKSEGSLASISYKSHDYRGEAHKFQTETPIKLENLTLNDLIQFRERIIRKRRKAYLFRGMLKVLKNFIRRPSVSYLKDRWREYHQLKYMG